MPPRLTPPLGSCESARVHDRVRNMRPRSRGCTLILTEGDSAKALAVAGLEVVGRDRYGAFPLKGKPLNVRDASTKQVMDNVEVRRLCTILGLDFNKTYETEAEHVF